jgi:hypothetical protein
MTVRMKRWPGWAALQPLPTDVIRVAPKILSPQVRKFIFVAPQSKLRFSKAQLRFKLLDAPFNRNF